ncbi:MAG: hypothetical protein M3Y45_07390 [Actinomycetota bacterium]|nr:hypothetical protein [Actinomycetota bacterium]
MSGPADEKPRPRTGVGRLLAGNPLQDENVAFRWLIAILIAAVTVVLVAKLISPAAAVIWGILLMLAVGVVAIRAVIYMLGSPDDAEAEPGDGSAGDRPRDGSRESGGK